MKLSSLVSDSANVFNPPIKLNNNSIPKCPSQKHLRIVFLMLMIKLKNLPN